MVLFVYSNNGNVVGRHKLYNASAINAEIAKFHEDRSILSSDLFSVPNFPQTFKILRMVESGHCIADTGYRVLYTRIIHYI